MQFPQTDRCEHVNAADALRVDGDVDDEDAVASVIFVDEDGVRFAFAVDDVDDGFTDILTDDNVTMTVLMMLLLLTVVADDDICYW